MDAIVLTGEVNEAILNVKTNQAPSGCGPMLSSANEAGRTLRQQFFEFVRAAGAIARVDVARHLDISPATVTSLSGDLIEQGLIHEIASAREAGRGRPRVSLGVVPDAHLVVGMKMSDREHTAVLADFAGNVLSSVAIDHETPFHNQAAMLSLIEKVVDAVCKKGDMARSAISGIGIGVPGFVEHESGLVRWSPLLKEEQLPLNLAQLVTDHLKAPTTIDNDANLATLAELWFGAGRDSADFAVVTIEHGVGMGMVINRQLFRGSKGLGMELGHTKVQLEGALCRCGQRGCLEAYLADYALAREAATALGDEVSGLPHNRTQIVEALFERANDGHVGAKSIFDRAGNYLALGLSNVANLFDPKRIILSGARMKYDLLYTSDVLSKVDRLAVNSGVLKTNIEVRTWGDLIWARGAAALALDDVSCRILDDK